MFPSPWIDGDNRDWAFETYNMLGLIESSFVEAVAAWSLFHPVTQETALEYLAEMHRQSRYERCLNSLYAKVFVYSLESITKLLNKLPEEVPARVNERRMEYGKHFGHLRHIRDSAIHIEDRGRGLTKGQKPVRSPIIVLGSFLNGLQFSYTGEDGTIYGIEISENTLDHAHRILQDVINSYQWLGVGDFDGLPNS